MSAINFSDTQLSQLLQLVVDSATSAGELLLNRFHDQTRLNVDLKDDGKNNLVTEMDRQAEALLRSRLGVADGIRFLGEESGGNESMNGATWVVDPIDGTVNYAHRVPIWSVSIALVVDGDPVLGVVYDPNRNELFSAVSGNGATLNGAKISVSEISEFRKSLLVTGFPYNVNENPHGTIDLFGKVVGEGVAVRRLGSAALDLAYIAGGRFDGFWEVELHPWDVAAGVLLVREAGGSVSSYAPGQNFTTKGLITDRLLATNGTIHDELLEFIREV